MRINLGYPELEAEKIILKNSTTMNLDKIDVVFTDTELKKLFRIIEQIEVGEKVYDYLLSLSQVIREQGFDFSTEPTFNF